MNVDEILHEELKRCFEFFKDFSNQDKISLGYGLVVDRSNNLDVSSIASVGYKLTVYVIAVERGYIKMEDAQEHVLGTLKTLYHNVDHYNGFFAHFVEMKTGKRARNCEYSTIDTALCLEGILTVMSYFKDQEIQELSQKIIKRVDYQDFIFEKDQKKMFHMSYNPDKAGAYRNNSENAYIWQWEHYAEQLMMYQHLAFNDEVSDQLLEEVYNGFVRPTKEIEGVETIYSYGGSMFIYQFNNAWFDYQKYNDINNINWFEHAKRAIKANQTYAITRDDLGLNEYLWGLAAGDSENGYRVYGAPPMIDSAYERLQKQFDGTVQQYAILASLPFHPELVKKSVKYLYDNYPESFMTYGFSDGMNFSHNRSWFCPNYLGLDKGITAIMIDNYFYGTTWKYYQENPLVKKAIKRLKFQKK